MNPLYVGIDVSSKTNVVYLMKPDGSKISNFSVANSLDGSNGLKGTEHSIADIRVIVNEIPLNFRTNQDDYFRQSLATQREHRNFSILYHHELARHQLVKLGIAGNLLTNGTRELLTLRNPLSCTDIRDITELKVGDIKELGKLDTAMDT